MTEHPRVSVVVPAYNEGEDVLGALDRLFESVRLPCEVLVVVDFPGDTTVPVAEIPTIWLDRQAGVSNFKVARWVPSYVRWYRFAFGPRLTAEQVRDRGPEAAGLQREQQKRRES